MLTGWNWRKTEDLRVGEIIVVYYKDRENETLMRGFTFPQK
jgi:hypothetical protein